MKLSSRQCLQYRWQKIVIKKLEVFKLQAYGIRLDFVGRNLSNFLNLGPKYTQVFPIPKAVH